jgi:hypothetical protein
MFENLLETAAFGDVERVLAETHDVANQAKKKNSDTHFKSDRARWNERSVVIVAD